MQYLLKEDGLMIKWIFLQHIFILYDFLSENYVGYNFIHFTRVTEMLNEINSREIIKRIFQHIL